MAELPVMPTTRIKSNLIFSIVLSITFFVAFSQESTDTLMQMNRGRKSGYWPVYLDSNAQKTDSASAYFIAWEYYENGKNRFDFYEQSRKTRDSAVFQGILGEKGKPVKVSGKFTWYERRDAKITYEENYENGMPRKFKEINYKKKNGRWTWALIRNWEFDKKFRGQRGTYLLTEQNNQSVYNVEEWARFWYRKGRWGYKRYRIRHGHLI
jgi:hypothetical protein